MVSEFIEAFEASTDIELWYKLIREELEECLEAMQADLKKDTVPSFCQVLKEFTDLNYVMCGAVLTAERHDVQSDIPLDLLGGFVEITAAVQAVTSGKDLAECFRRVHLSNMSKLGEDGLPVRREDGKVLKGPNYQPPDLTDVAYRILVKLGETK
jgi:predicted HAD superfamily Cof-like phosphohydrolase